MLGTTLPTPLYVIYQGRWHFSAAMVTVTFAAYAATVLATLLLAGRSSDQAGRRPVMAVALAASALSTVLFILAPGIGVLIAARVVSGLYLAVLAAAALLMLLVPETVRPRTRPALRFAGLGIPERGRGEFIAAALAQSGMALFLAGTAAGGVAVGAIFGGSLATASHLAPAGRRGQVISAFFVACYAGLIIPVIGVGVLAGFTGTFPAVLAFSILLAALCLFSIARIASPGGSV